MKALTCAAARRRLQALYDGELPVADQIAVETHLEACVPCADSLAEVRSIGAILRAGGLGRDFLSNDEATAFRAAVLGRSTAEQEASFLASVHNMFDDMHLVYAGLGATIATAVCVITAFSMVWFAPTEHPDASPSASLAATLNLLATPGTSVNAIVNDAASHARGSARFQAASETAQEDAVFWIESMVTHEGRLINLDRLRTTDQKTSRDRASQIEGLLESVARARIDPGGEDRASAIDGIVWVITSTTVHATKVIGSDLPLPPMSDKQKPTRRHLLTRTV